MACSQSPADVLTLTDVVQLAAGDSHTVALRRDGTVWTWGWNDLGQLGTPAADDEDCGGVACRTSPAQVPGLTGVAGVAAGAEHSLALESDGTVWAWGNNASGQVGDGGTTDVVAPVQVLAGATALGAGFWHSLAVKGDGTVWAWGDDDWGQLGVDPAAEACGALPCRRLPVQAPGVGGVTAVAGAVGHSLALRGDGTVWAWGSGEWGELGDGALAQRTAPGAVPGLGAVIAIAAGEDHSVAVTSDGAVWTWDCGDDGQLGVPVAGNAVCGGGYGCRATPTRVSGLSGVSAIEAWNYTLARQADGSLWGGASTTSTRSARRRAAAAASPASRRR